MGVTPGLLDCVRGGQVTVANALGSGLAESSALMAFLPNLARRPIGEDLRIPSVATWWCGQEGRAPKSWTGLANW